MSSITSNVIPKSFYYYAIILISLVAKILFQLNSYTTITMCSTDPKHMLSASLLFEYYFVIQNGCIFCRNHQLTLPVCTSNKIPLQKYIELERIANYYLTLIAFARQCKRV